MSYILLIIDDWRHSEGRVWKYHIEWQHLKKLLLRYGNSRVKMEEFPLKLKVNKMKYSEVKKNQTREDFISFLRCLKKKYVEDLESWANKDIGAFLEAMALGDSDDVDQNLSK